MGGKGQVFKDHPLWLARYGSGAREPQPAPGAGSWTFWQYTESERVPGMPGAKNAVGTADRNVYRGTLAQLRAMANLGSTPTPPQPETSWPTVKSGQRGVDVTTVQLLLTARGHATEADGVFGAGTAAKVRAFQKAHRLRADGIAGPATWAALVRGGGSGGGGGTPGGGKLSDAQASAKLKAAGISRVSSGNCTDRNRRNCTSLQGIRVGTVNGVISLKKKSGCKVVVTGGTETGHAGGEYSHWNGA